MLIFTAKQVVASRARASNRSRGSINRPAALESRRRCCQIRNAVLLGSHSHRSTRLERNDSRLKSSAGSVNVRAPSLTVLVPSLSRVIVVPVPARAVHAQVATPRRGAIHQTR
mgnify:CR=1 FL=1